MEPAPVPVPAAAAEVKSCIVCKQQPGKYKCPKCFVK